MTTPPHETQFPDRTVRLSDGRPGLRSTLSVDVRNPATPHPPAPEASPSPGGEGRGEGGTAVSGNGTAVLDFVSSDATLDRYSEIISPAGWNLTTYRRNPVFQNAHQYGDIIFTLGKALLTEIRSLPTPNSELLTPCLYQRIEFATAANPLAKIAHALYAAGFLHAVSVGFIPLRWQDAPEVGHASSLPASVSPEDCRRFSLSPSEGERAGVRGCLQASGPQSASPAPRRIYLEQELLEVSAVAIPANPNALALAYKSGAVEKSDLRDLADLLHQTLAHSSADEVPPSPRGEGRGEGEFPLSTVPTLLALARELHRLLHV